MERLGEIRKGRRERIEKGSRERIEIERKERKKKPKPKGSYDDNLKRRRNITACLCFFLKALRYSEDMSSRLDFAVKHCSSEVLIWRMR